MHRNFKKHLFHFILFGLIPTILYGQTYRDNDPYTYFGIGNITDLHSANLQGIGGAQSAFQSPVYINTANPGSYASIAYATLEMGLFANGLWMTQNELDSFRSGSTSVGYFKVGFPIKKNVIGSSIGFLPFSNISYDVRETRQNQELGQERVWHLGAGDLYELYYGIGGKYKGFSAGMHFGFVFGNISKTLVNDFPDQFAYLGNAIQTDDLIKDMNLRFGVQYSDSLFRNGVLTVGLSGNPKIELDGLRDESWARVGSNEEIFSVLDTVSFASGAPIAYQTPAKLNFGVAYQMGKSWAFHSEIRYTNGSALSAADASYSYKNALGFSLGTSVLPDYKASTNFWQKTEYRFGLFYDQNILTINNTSISEYGLSFGFGLPLRRIGRITENRKFQYHYSRLNLSLQVGQKGTTSNGLINQTFLRTTMGMNLNDIWFVKRKFD